MAEIAVSGLNSGVMLLNLTRMRHLDIENRALEVHEQYKEDLRWGDQDIFNVILHSHPGKSVTSIAIRKLRLCLSFLIICTEYAFRLPCEYNFRTSHCYCRYAGNCSCKTASNQGVRIVHGNLKAFLTTEYPFFRNIFEAMKHVSSGLKNTAWNHFDFDCFFNLFRPFMRYFLIFIFIFPDPTT